MRDLGGHTLFSASDLMRFTGCVHATTLDLAHMRGTGPEPGDDTEDAVLLQKQGGAHEAAHLAHFKAAAYPRMARARLERGKAENWSLAQQESGEFSPAVSTTRTRHALLQKNAMYAEIRLSPLFSSQPFQPAAPSLQQR